MHDEAYKAEIAKLTIQLNGMRDRLARRDRRIEEAEKKHKEELASLRTVAEERKQVIDALSAENGRLKRRLKREQAA